MRILMVGGGSGGHVTPLKAVAKEIKLLDSKAQIEVVTDRKFGSQTKAIFADFPGVTIKQVFAGKLRRYNTKSLLWHVLHLPTLSKNILDVFKIVLGTFQLGGHLLVNKPDVVFCKGGFVSVPAGLIAHLFRVPLVIHDSDTHPGLSSRIIAPWARVIATGMPTKYYPYSLEKMVYAGIPVNTAYKPVSKSGQQQQKRHLGFSADEKLVLITGGGTGAQSLNAAVDLVAQRLIDGGWQIAHITGSDKAKQSLLARELLKSGAGEKWQIHEFVDMLPYITAADVVITRAGATIMQELANAQKTAVIVPSRFLAGGHQLKNAQMFEEANSVIVVDDTTLETDPDALLTAVKSLESDANVGQAIARNLHQTFAKPDAAKVLAKEIIKQAKI